MKIFGSFEFKRTNQLNQNEILNLGQLDQNEMPFPWTVNQWEDLKGSSNYLVGFFRSSDLQMVGFSLFYIPVADEAELLKICLRKNIRGQGAGGDLLTNSLNLLKSIGVEKVFLEVQEGNGAAIALYLKLGFEKNRTVRSFYSNGDSALIFSRQLGT